MAVALDHHRAGRLAQAEAIYRQILAQVPDHAGALHMLGVLTGEWKATSSRTRQMLAAAVAVTLVSVIVLNLGGLF